MVKGIIGIAAAMAGIMATMKFAPPGTAQLLGAALSVVVGAIIARA